MTNAPIARLQSLSAEEKVKLLAILKRKLLVRAIVFVSVILSSFAIVVYVNKHSGIFGSADSLGLINVFFVVVIVIFSRMLYSEIMDYRKEAGSSNKKVIRTRIAGRDGDKIILGNKSFSKEEILLDNSDFDLLKGGDEVLLELSARSNTIFSVKKAREE